MSGRAQTRPSILPCTHKKTATVWATVGHICCAPRPVSQDYCDAGSDIAGLRCRGVSSSPRGRRGRACLARGACKFRRRACCRAPQLHFNDDAVTASGIYKYLPVTAPLLISSLLNSQKSRESTANIYRSPVAALSYALQHLDKATSLTVIFIAAIISPD
jgi:hypothetical protein